jgi:myosin-1
MSNNQLHSSIRTAKQAGLSDAVLLKPDPKTDQVSEESFLNNLEERFRAETIYTYIGDVVVSVNPFKPLQGLYNQTAINMYRGKYYYEVPPHIYSISDDANRYVS